MTKVARERLSKAVPYMLDAVTKAEKEGAEGAKVSFAIITRSPDGSGRVTGEFECREFLADVASVIGGVEPITDEDRAVMSILSRL